LNYFHHVRIETSGREIEGIDLPWRRILHHLHRLTTMTIVVVVVRVDDLV
jgi:hypothetical protein